MGFPQQNIIIADSSKVFGIGLQALLKNLSFVKEVEIVDSFKEVLELCKENNYQLVIIDDHLVNTEDLGFIKTLRAKSTKLSIVVSSEILEQNLIDQLISNNINGFIPKPASDNVILKTVHDVLKGDVVDNKQVTQNLKATICKRSLEYGTLNFDLTKKELEVLYKITEGKSNKVIASEMGLTERTVEFHKTNLYKKTHSNSLADLVHLTIVTRLL
jgi:DNA-binding NarL/FixJ family response regulator